MFCLGSLQYKGDNYLQCLMEPKMIPQGEIHVLKFILSSTYDWIWLITNIFFFTYFNEKWLSPIFYEWLSQAQKKDFNNFSFKSEIQHGIFFSEFKFVPQTKSKSKTFIILIYLTKKSFEFSPVIFFSMEILKTKTEYSFFLFKKKKI